MSDFHFGLMLLGFNIAYFVYFRWRVTYYLNHMPNVVPPKFMGFSWLNFLLMAFQWYMFAYAVNGSVSLGMGIPSLILVGLALVVGYQRSYYITKEAKILAEQFRSKALNNAASSGEYEWGDSSESDHEWVQWRVVTPILMFMIAIFIIRDVKEGWSFWDILLEYGEILAVGAIWVWFEVIDHNRD